MNRLITNRQEQNIMVKKIKHVALNRRTPPPLCSSPFQGDSWMVATNDDPTRGTEENPYSIDEAYSLYYAGLWVGGWVECYGYIPADLEDWGYYGSGSGTSSSCDPYEEEINPGDGDDGLGHGGNEDENGENKEEENQNGNQGNGNTGGGGINSNEEIEGDNSGVDVMHHQYVFPKEYDLNDMTSIITSESIEGAYDVFRANNKSFKIGGHLTINYHPIEFNWTDGNTQITYYRNHMIIITGGTWALFKFLVRNISYEWQALYNGGLQINDNTPCEIRTVLVERAIHSIPTTGYNSMIHSHPDSTIASDGDKASAYEYSLIGYNYFAIVNKFNFSPQKYNPYTKSEYDTYKSPK